MKVFIVQHTHRDFFVDKEQAEQYKQQLINNGVMGCEIKIEEHGVK